VGSATKSVVRLAALVCAMLALSPTSHAAYYERLSELEKGAVDQALAQYDLAVEFSPEGKKIGRVWISTSEVFGPENGFFQIFNVFHTTTRDTVIEREQILQPGSPFEWQRLQDMERNLRDPTYRSIALVIAVKPKDAAGADFVDLLVVTRDVWSLRANTDFRFAQTLTYLSVELAENNVAGYNKRAAATAVYELDTIALGLRYVDPRLFWSRYFLLAEHSFLINHDTGKYEGVRGQVSATYPLFSATSPWGWSIGTSYNSEVFRSFQGVDVRRWDNPETEDVENFPIEYDWLNVRAFVSATRSFGVSTKNDITFGYSMSQTDATPGPAFDSSPEAREVFSRTMVPRSEFSSGLNLGWRFYLWQFAQLYDFNTFSLLEEFRTGPYVSVSTRWASRALFRSDTAFASFSVSAGWVLVPGGDSYVGVEVGTSGRVQGELVDHDVFGTIRLASPRLWRAFRLHAYATGTWQVQNRGNSFYSLGGDTGYRGAAPGSLLGENILRTNVELRTMSFPLWILRVGGVAFYDGGDAFDDGALSWNHAVGIGARVLILSANRNVLRVDYGVPLQGNRAGFSGGTITAGFEQAF
jgi:hypothetical protein